jgi:hypothetical protein
MQFERAEQQPARVAFLVASFLKAIERQRRHDGEVIAGLVRVLRRGGPDADQLCRLINHRLVDASAKSRDEERRVDPVLHLRNEEHR